MNYVSQMASRKPAKFVKTPSTILSDSINRLTLKEPAGKEANFEDETHVVRNSAAENYFMQGKSSQMNAARRGRKKLGRVESSSDEDEDTKKKKTDDPTKQFSLQKLSSFVEKTSKEKLKKVKEFEKSFDYWTEVYFASEFNICLIGAGSKNAVLNLYHQHLTDAGETTFIVEGFKEEASVRAILQVLFDELKLKKETGKDTASWARQITEYLSHRKEKIYMFLHNIDSTNYRDPADQRALATLSSTPWLRLITTLDHLKTTMMWDSKLALLFNFVFVEASTFDFSLENLVASKSTALGLNPKNKSSSHTMASLDVLWQSLAENAKKIFAIFFGMTFASGQGVPFWDLFNAARDDFLVSSDAALRQLLVEFEDHRILNRRRREDGNENLLSCIERQLVEAFLAEKNITLEI